jgi:hypothetical protein
MTCIWKNTKVLFFELKKPAKSQAFLSQAEGFQLFWHANIF